MQVPGVRVHVLEIVRPATAHAHAFAIKIRHQVPRHLQDLGQCLVAYSTLVPRPLQLFDAETHAAAGKRHAGAGSVDVVGDVRVHVRLQLHRYRVLQRLPHPKRALCAAADLRGTVERMTRRRAAVTYQHDAMDRFVGQHFHPHGCGFRMDARLRHVHHAPEPPHHQPHADHQHQARQRPRIHVVGDVADAGAPDVVAPVGHEAAHEVVHRNFLCNGPGAAGLVTRTTPGRHGLPADAHTHAHAALTAVGERTIEAEGG
ncbi:hypothetical protein D3C81_1193800 [compost metagenome]